MNKILSLLLIALLIAPNCFSDTYGYFLDNELRITGKSQVVEREPYRDGYTFIPCSYETYDSIEIYEPIEKIQETLILEEIDSLKRAEAITSLKDKGKLPPDYKDKKKKKEVE